MKVLDFGRAPVGAADSNDPGNSPTAAYMAPGTGTGEVVDKRTDIRAFGVVLYEILTGKQLLHRGDRDGRVLAGVLTREPDLNLAPSGRRRIARCLEKDLPTD